MQTFDTNLELIQTLTEDIKLIVENAIKEKGKAYLLLSGGSTPLPLYKSIANCDLDWDKIHIGLVDERFVDQIIANRTDLKRLIQICGIEFLNRLGIYPPLSQSVRDNRRDFDKKYFYSQIEDIL